MIDWSTREHIRAKLLILVKYKLNQSNYTPNKKGKAIQTVLEQAETLCRDWVA